MSKFKVLEGINAFLGFYIILAYALLWYLGTVPEIFIYLTPLIGVVLLAYHVKMSSDLKKSVLGSGSLLNLRFASSTGFTFVLFLLAILCVTIGCLFAEPIAFILSMLFVLDHALYISIDKNQINPKKQKSNSTPLLAAA
ncbi:hypothetical protein [Methanimicrococcus blatticola]|uniref:Uncharacterized protein n=1 Tax=Methanimicrococcus blatticola TaxID=91560 RepID=A0A484F694_9EURY|nr:hypothetical protein [Methanimicrococcus blatticola]MBZ3935121.1 hypothetical protein [Methanimicrococcus blatticola]MCC2508782.1 hypothetical protein [Methanimicrococcus blatticola]TDQ71184.1 hypothetical protein C7391_0288 [Methanimicrococcus blatticola]